MLMWLQSVNDEAVGVVNHRVVPVAADMPNDDLVTLADLLTGKDCTLRRGSAYMDDG